MLAVFVTVILALSLSLGGCGHSQLKPPQSALPAVLYGRAEVVPADDPAYDKADQGAAVKPQGEGGISSALVIRTTTDIPVYRMWNGPDKVNARGQTNRLGQWWAYDAPSGTRAQYRARYDICLGWNDLTWMARCTLKSGSVVAIGPGQSVSAETCGDTTGKESYPANPGYWQTWIAKAWARPQTLDCPPVSHDYRADPNDIAQPLSP